LGLGLQNIIMFSFHHETDTLIAYEKVREHVLMKIPIFDHFILYDATKVQKKKVVNIKHYIKLYKVSV
jgi:hypothetical protein